MTDQIQLKLGANGRGAFVIDDGDKRVAEMEVSIADGNLTVYHTEVSEELKDQGVAGKLLAEMVKYVRENHLMVIVLCPYVHAQFKRHPELYTDIWNQHWHK